MPTNLFATSSYQPHNPQQFSNTDIEQWFQEAGQKFRALEVSGEERLDINFFYHDKPVGLFAKLMGQLYRKFTEEPGQADTEVEREYVSLLRSHHSRLNTAEAFLKYYPENKNIVSFITIGRNNLAVKPVSAVDTNGPDGFSIDVREKFHITFFHELGHLVSNAHELAGASHLDYQPKINWSSTHTPLAHSHLLEEIFQSYSQPEPVAPASTLPPLPSSDTLPQHAISETDFHYIEQSFHQASTQLEDALSAQKTQRISAHSTQQLKRQEKQLFILREEMFADCFSALMCLQEGNPQKLIDNMASSRTGMAGGPAFFSEYKFTLMGARITHYTAPALEHLQDILTKLNITVEETGRIKSGDKVLDLRDLKDLCHECANYGLTHFMYEASLFQPEYRTFIDLKEDITAQAQGDFFSSDNQKNSDILFSFLSESDKLSSQEKVDKYSRLLQSLKTEPQDSESFLPTDTPSVSLSEEQYTLVEFAAQLTEYYCDRDYGACVAAYSTVSNPQVFEQVRQFNEQLHIQQTKKIDKTLPQNQRTNGNNGHNGSHSNNGTNAPDLSIEEKIFNQRSKQTQGTLIPTQSMPVSTGLSAKIQKIKLASSQSLDKIYCAPPQPYTASK